MGITFCSSLVVLVSSLSLITKLTSNAGTQDLAELKVPFDLAKYNAVLISVTLVAAGNA